jgi:hypothetical protein
MNNNSFNMNNKVGIDDNINKNILKHFSSPNAL